MDVLVAKRLDEQFVARCCELINLLPRFEVVDVPLAGVAPPRHATFLAVDVDQPGICERRWAASEWGIGRLDLVASRAICVYMTYFETHGTYLRCERA